MHPSRAPDPSAAVYINGRFLSQRITGVQRYGREVLSALDDLLGEPAASPARWTVLAPTGTPLPALRHIDARHVGRGSGHAWEQLSLPWHCRDGLLLGFGFTGPVLTGRQMITIHDGAVVRMPGVYSRPFRLWYRAVVGIVVRRAPVVLTVSQFSRQEAIACFGAAPSSIEVMGEGWQHLLRVNEDEGILDRVGVRGRPFVLAVSSPTPNKNFAVIGRALARMGEQAPLCVAVGATDPGVFQDAGRPSQLRFAGYVSDGELKALYRAAACFVMPSFYEGFGLPLLEAMALGCPVIASTAPSLVEVSGGAGRHFEPSDAQALAAQLSAVLGDRQLGARMREAGLSRAREFSWSASARRHLEVVNASMPGGHGSHRQPA